VRNGFVRRGGQLRYNLGRFPFVFVRQLRAGQVLSGLGQVGSLVACGTSTDIFADGTCPSVCLMVVNGSYPPSSIG
jgi:hypothetical protein